MIRRCAIYFCFLVCFLGTPSFMLVFLSSGQESLPSPSGSLPKSDDEPPLGDYMTSGRWDMSQWKITQTGGVTMMEALGINRGKIKFPPLQPAQVPQEGQSSERQQTSTGSGSGGSGGKGLPGGPGSPGANQALGQRMAAAVGWTGDQWTALNNIVMAESGWETEIHNGGGMGYVPGLAYGIPQALPGSKMASAGANWQTSAATQIKWMLGYIRSSYGNPVNAWNFHLAHGWY